MVIGENAAGEATAGERSFIRSNDGDGVLIENGADNAIVRNTLLLANAGYGLRLADGHQNEVFGNTVAGNGSGGIMIENDSDANRLGRPLVDPVPAVERNVIHDSVGDSITLAVITQKGVICPIK